MSAPSRSRLLLFASGFAVLAAGCSAGDAPASGPVVEGEPIGVQGAHEHGVMRLGLAVDGAMVSASIEVPAQLLYGFEHAARTDEERSAVRTALERLRAQGGEVVAFSEAAACAAGPVEVTESPDHEADGHEHAEGDAHSEVRFTVVWTCATPPEGTQARLQVARILPDAADVDLTVVTSLGSAGARVEPDADFRL